MVGTSSGYIAGTANKWRKGERNSKEGAQMIGKKGGLSYKGILETKRKTGKKASGKREYKK